jgi:GNAT superfamily N-acetyltransferase
MMTEPPITEASDVELAGLVEANFHSWFRSMAVALNGDLEETPKLSRYHCAPGGPIFKGVWGARLAPEEADAAIDDTVAWFEARNAPFFFWWKGADTQPAFLGIRLKKHGFSAFEIDAVAMAADIEKLQWDNPRPPELRFETVENDAQLQQFKNVFIESFGLPAWVGQSWVDATNAVGLGRTPWTMCLGILDGKPVCSGLSYCGAGVVGLQGLGTLPAYRRQGIGSAMQLELFRQARDMGYRYAVLSSNKVGESTYLKLGFQDTGRRISRYIWRKG